MFGKKKDLKPYFRDYNKMQHGFKKYIVDTVEYLRRQGDEKAIAFNLDEFVSIMPNEVTPDSLMQADSPVLRKMLKTILRDMGWAVFGDLLADTGITEQDLALMMQASESDFVNQTGKHVPGSRSANSIENMADKIAKQNYDSIVEKIGQRIDVALATNNMSVLDEVVHIADEAAVEFKQIAPDFEVPDVMNELIASTRVFQELMDNNRTTVEEYQSFLNKLIAFFIEDEVVDTNRLAVEQHKNHDDCDVAKHPTEPLKVLYRRIYSPDDESPPIEGLALIVFDTVRAVLHPIAFSIHESLTDRTIQQFNEQCRTQEGNKFLISKMMSFVEDDAELAKQVLNLKSLNDDGSDESLYAATLAVSPEVINPKAEIMSRLLGEVRETFNADAESVFADISPDDFK